MAKIVYGVSGEGSGHSSRARIVAKHLVNKGHEVKIVTYDRGIKNLQDEFDVIEVEGLSIETHDNRVSKSKTFTKNLSILPDVEKRFSKLKKIAIKEFNPDCIITDFEPQTAYLANYYNLPLITIDNQHRMRYLHYECPTRMIPDALLVESIIRGMVPRPDYSIITSFYDGKLKNDRSCITPPILREEIIGLKSNDGDKILVYLTKGYESLVDLLKQFPRETFLVYGYDREEEVDNIIFKPFSTTGFSEDLANCKAIIGTAGFTLMTEGFYLKKPFLATPMKGQFEQEFNSYMLEQIGFGRDMGKLDKTIISAFLYEIPDYRNNLLNYKTLGNKLVTDKLDELLADDLKLIKSYHKKRSLNDRLESLFDFLEFK